MSARQHVGCNVTTCPNGKCRATGECVDQVVARQHVKISERHERQLEHAPNMRPPLFGNVDDYGYCTADLENGCTFPSCFNCPRVPMDRHVPPAPPPVAVAKRRVIDADSATRKTYPLARGLLDYFPDALAEVARVSHIGNEKHNPGEAMHHARGKSMDHADCIMRHLVGRGGFDGDTRESAALAWRALALLQEELEREIGLPLPRGARAASASG